jgi:hypothetical protein
LAGKPGRPARTLIAGGSTASCGFYAPAFDRAFSQGVLNGGPVETYFLLRKWLSARRPPACALLSFSWVWPNYKRFFWQTFVRSGLYSYQDAQEIFGISEKLKSFPSDNYSRVSFDLRYWLYRGRILGLQLADIQRSIFEGSTNGRFLRGIVNTQGSVQLQRKFNLDEIPQLSGAVPGGDEGPLMAYYMEETLKLLRDKSTRIYYYQVPYQAGDKTDHRPPWLPEMLKNYGVHVLDMKVEYSEDDFSFPGHLSADKAQEISQKLSSLMDCGPN